MSVTRIFSSISETKSIYLIYPLIILFHLKSVISLNIATYYLNKYLPYNASFSGTDQETECLFTQGNFSINPTQTICYRYNAYSYAGPGYPYVDLLQFGRMKEDFSDISEGFIWGNWPNDEVTSSQWLGFPVRKTATYAWASFPTFEDNYTRNVWKHQCFSINFLTGRVKYVLNGKPIYNVRNLYQGFKEELDLFPRYFDFLSLGCAYQTTGSKIKSMVGQISDLQIFGTELRESQMKAYTSCTDFIKGDLLRWDSIPWTLTGRRQVSELEYLDLETEICNAQNSSHILVPIALKKEPFGEQMCSKLSSNIASYTNEQDLEPIVQFLASQINLNENAYKR